MRRISIGTEKYADSDHQSYDGFPSAIRTIILTSTRIKESRNNLKRHQFKEVNRNIQTSSRLSWKKRYDPFYYNTQSWEQLKKSGIFSINRSRKVSHLSFWFIRIKLWLTWISLRVILRRMLNFFHSRFIYNECELLI